MVRSTPCAPTNGEFHHQLQAVIRAVPGILHGTDEVVESQSQAHRAVPNSALIVSCHGSCAMATGNGLPRGGYCGHPSSSLRASCVDLGPPPAPSGAIRAACGRRRQGLYHETDIAEYPTAIVPLRSAVISHELLLELVGVGLEMCESCA